MSKPRPSIFAVPEVDIICEPAGPPNKYPDVLDPIREEAKAEKRRLMGKFALYFAPHTAQHAFAYEPNAFSYEINSPVKPHASYPRFLVCHMCGGGFGPQSLELHLKVCEEKWDATEAQREPGEPTRDIPSRPSVTPADPNNWTREEVDEYNKQATEAYNENGMDHFLRGQI